MVKVSHNNVNVVIHISVLKVTSTVVLQVYELLQRGEECTVSFRSICMSGANTEKVFRIH